MVLVVGLRIKGEDFVLEDRVGNGLGDELEAGRGGVDVVVGADIIGVAEVVF